MGHSVPNGVISFWPIPTTAHRIAIYSWRTLDRFLVTTDPAVLPPGYQRAIEYSLALELPRKSHDPDGRREARKALAWVKANNQRCATFPYSSFN